MPHQEPVQSLPLVQMDDGAQNDVRETNLSLEELLYSSASFHAISIPVSTTMILTALCVIFVNTAETIEKGEAALSATYEAFDNSRDSNAATLGISLLNALIIVSTICAMTFVIVLLYKFRCMKCLVGYMIFSSAALLGFLGGFMFQVAITKYSLFVDKFTFYFAMLNFAVVGVVSIFWQKGIPMWITQSYLVATSVILAWQLSHFDPWTAWALLIMLALYDLCAVLTPCGPLRALVNLMHQDGSPNMPGLLYEANLPTEARRPGRQSSAEGNTFSQHTAGTAMSEEPSAASTDAPVQISSDSVRGAHIEATDAQMTHVTRDTVEGPQNEVVPSQPGPTARIPLAIARLYRLQILEDVEPRRLSFSPLLGEGGVTYENDQNTQNASLSPQYTPEQLKSYVTAVFPRRGGRIELGRNATGAVRYAVRDRNNNIVRILLVDDEGRVLEENHTEGGDDDDPGRNSIKLGLGDFIFYSVLVAIAVQYSFTTFAACFLVILTGLGGTLVLLAVYKHALPALPISIFLGVLFYLLTRVLIEPWIHAVFNQPYYA